MPVLKIEESTSFSICTFSGDETPTFLSEEKWHKCDVYEQMMCTKYCVPWKYRKTCLTCYHDTLFINQNTLKYGEALESELILRVQQIPYNTSYLQLLEFYETYKEFDVGVSRI